MSWSMIAAKEVDPADIAVRSSGTIHLVHLKIDDIQKFASALIQDIGDTSWINKMDLIPQLAYRSAVEQTSKMLVKMFETITNTITSEFGEYAVSLSASQALNIKYSHTRIPIAELWKTQISGNPGFDFHTESENNKIVFGEAKYNSRSNAYGKAAEQVIDFINDKKHLNDIVHLQYFATKESIENLKSDNKGIALAFSLNSDNKPEALHRALTNANVRELIRTSDEIYLIGVEA